MSVLETKASTLGQELTATRLESDRLFRILSDAAIYERPIDQRHRVIFYLGHLDGFDAIQICREALRQKSPDPELDALFQAGIDPDSGHLPSDVPADWPSLEQVTSYVARCRQRVDQCFNRAPEDVTAMALEHRQMHLETLAYMFHNFDYALKNSPDTLSSAPPSRPTWHNSWCEVPAGEAILGKRRDDAFGWDNEYPEVRARVPSFRVQRYSVTNGEYLKFVDDGAPLPNFWVRRSGSLLYRGMFREEPLPFDWPVYVTQAEAAAYADWLGKSLLSEEQFHRAAYGTPSAGHREYPWGSTEPARTLGNFDFHRWDPEPVHGTPSGDSAWGVAQMVGNGWEWTNTEFAPFPGFQPRSTYPGYSANFFDGEHYVMKGGSARTAARLLRRSFRNWFRRDYPYMYATFRCVEN